MNNLYSLPSGMERWTDDTGQPVIVHSEERCSTRCSIHFPEKSLMNKFPRMWNNDVKMMQRICTHAIAHTDDLQFSFFVMTVGHERAERIVIHDCDGCCREYIDGEVVVKELES